MWWPTINSDIEKYIKGCHNCAIHQNSAKPTIGTWPECTKPWQRIHIDFAGPFLGHTFIIIVDAYSRWPEVYAMKTVDTTDTINVLGHQFSRYGVPDYIVSDNGAQFTSHKFNAFTKHHNITHLKSAPFHPSTNGEAERFVQTFKNNMKRREANHNNVKSELLKFLLAYRTVPHSVTGQTPAQLFMGRELRNKFQLIESTYIYPLQELPKKSYEIHDTVMARKYDNHSPGKWSAGKIHKKLGAHHYLININNRIQKRHVDQIKPFIANDSIRTGLKEDIATHATKILPHRSRRGIPRQRLNL